MKTLENQLADYGRIQDEVFGPISLDEISSRPVAAKVATGRSLVFGRHPVALALVAMIAVIIVVGGLAFLMGGSAEPDPVDQPTTGSFTWTSYPASDFTAFNYRPNTFAVAGDRAGFIASGNGTIWTSTDGGTWSMGPSGLTVLPGIAGEFLALGTDVVGEGWNYNGEYWRSDDGESWTEAVAESGRLPPPETIFWLGLTVDEILNLSLPESLIGRGPAGTVLKVGDRYVAYYWTPEHIVGGAVSADGKHWEEFEMPQFLTEWFEYSENGRAMWDRGFSRRLWSGTFTVGHDKVLALTAKLDGHQLWESTDGILWNESATTLPDPLLSPPEMDGSILGSMPGGYIPATHHITTMSTGWSLTPWDPPFSPTGSSAYHSVDGRTWQTLMPPDRNRRSILVAGDTIFFFYYSTVSETFHGVDIATLEDQSNPP